MFLFLGSCRLVNNENADNGLLELQVTVVFDCLLHPLNECLHLEYNGRSSRATSLAPVKALSTRRHLKLARPLVILAGSSGRSILFMLEARRNGGLAQHRMTTHDGVNSVEVTSHLWQPG